MSDTLKIKVYSTSNANIHATWRGVMEIDREDWEAMSEEQRNEEVQQFLFDCGKLEFGWEDPEDA